MDRQGRGLRIFTLKMIKKRKICIDFLGEEMI
jgi:hypothetical protein